jgi:hypothetical protein
MFCEMDVGLQIAIKICCKLDESARHDFGKYTPEFGDTVKVLE